MNASHTFDSVADDIGRLESLLGERTCTVARVAAEHAAAVETQAGFHEEAFRAIEAARFGGDLEWLAGLFADDAILRISGSSGGQPMAIRAQDAPEVRSWLTVLPQTFKVAEPQVLPKVIEGSRASVYGRMSIHSRITGASPATEPADLAEAHRGGRIRSDVEFCAPP